MSFLFISQCGTAAVALVLLAGCGRGNPETGEPGSPPQSGAAPSNAAPVTGRGGGPESSNSSMQQPSGGQMDLGGNSATGGPANGTANVSNAAPPASSGTNSAAPALSTTNSNPAAP